MPQTQFSAFKNIESLGINKCANGRTEEEENECGSILLCWKIMLIARFRREMLSTEATDQAGFSKADHSNVHCMDQQGADGMKPSLSFVVTGSQLSYKKEKENKEKR